MTASGEVPSSRLGRTARLGGLAAGQAARYAGTRAANLTRGRRRREHAIEQRHLDAAEQAFAVLGTMKGPAMKIGQMLSFVDLGVLPEAVRPRFKQRLAALCEAAPPIPFSQMEPVLTKSLAKPVDAVFDSFDPDPIGIASIGQVYRATLPDGRSVAVKVQYPRIAEAARADLKNLALMLRLAQSWAPSINMRSLGAALTDRFTEELDYSREARNSRDLADAYAGHPFIVVPAPIEKLCGPHLLVTEYVDGTDFSTVCAAEQPMRDRSGEIIFRFYMGSLMRLRRFSGDPHPGNLRQLPDGRLAFFDFGSYQRLDSRIAESFPATLRAAAERRGADLIRLLDEDRVMSYPDDAAPEQILEFLHATCGWLLADDLLTVTPTTASDMILEALAPPAEHRHGQLLPTEHVLTMRTGIAVLALLGGLTATANWHRCVREWIYGDPPDTELGRLEAEFFARRKDD